MLSLYIATLAALAGSAAAAISAHGLKILAPGGDNLWWIQGADNNLAWTCAEADASAQQFSIYINNSDTSLLTAITALVSVEQNFNCEQDITANLNTAPLGTGYTIVLTNILNTTDIFAVSDPFEIKALSAGYPPASATPVDQASATVSKGSASNSIGGATAASTSGGASPTKSSSASRTRALQGAGVLSAACALAAVVL